MVNGSAISEVPFWQGYRRSVRFFLEDNDDAFRNWSLTGLYIYKGIG